MSERADGYVTELPYTPGYHSGLDPRLVARRLGELGFESPRFMQACELGFGRGINLAIHAVAGTAQWWGNDLLHEHVEGVRALTRGLTDRLQVTSQSFVEFGARSDLPNFDFIGLHGVWSWVSATNREHIRQFIDRRLAPGGVVYLSYNVLAGWQSVLPLRDFLLRAAQGPEIIARSLAERIEFALQAAQAHVASEPPELEHDPEFERHLRRIRHQRKAYLAHEYFNRDWAPMRFADVAAALAPLGLVYAGQVTGSSTQPADNPAPGEIFSEEESDRLLRRSFRRDLWLRPGQNCAPLRIGSNAISVAESAGKTDSVVEPARVAATAALNDRLLRWAITEPQLSVVASPLTEGGVDLGWRGLLALAAWRAGLREPSLIAARISEWMQALDHPVIHGDTVISDAAEAAQILSREANEFCQRTVPRLRELLIEPG